MKLFYSGPARQQLHDQYAKQRRIDENAPVVSASELRIEAPVERVWQIIADPSGWPSVLEGRRAIRLDGGVTADADFIWGMGRTVIKSRFAVVDPHRELTWTGVAMGVKAIDRQVLTPTADGATVLRLEESMAAPLIGLVFNSRKLRAQHEQWLHAVRVAAEAPSRVAVPARLSA
jgi:hypothetical protein